MKRLLYISLSLMFILAFGVHASKALAEQGRNSSEVCMQSNNTGDLNGQCAQPILDTNYVAPPKTGSILSVVIIISGSIAAVISTILGWKRHIKSNRFSVRA
jgi:hypothetical protein